VDVRVVPPDAVATVGAGLVLDALRAAARPRPTLMPALGESALGVYRELGRMADAGAATVAGLRLVQLDEYLDIAPDDPRSLAGWLRRDVAAPLRVADADVVTLPSDTDDPDAASVAYDSAVTAAGGIDVAVLGLGPNGHLGFNEPPSPAGAGTRAVTLTPESLESNARYWPDLPVPTRALTAGMSTILAARRIVLVVTGAGKRTILRRMLSEPEGPALPASLLRSSPVATLLADEDAWPPDLARPKIER
jgi:glucosamine-6-phosphate deaminase